MRILLVCAAGLAVAITAAGCAGGAGGPADGPIQTGQPGQPAPQPAAEKASTGLTPEQDEPIVARVNGRQITLRQLQEPLLEAHGLNLLLSLIQLEMAMAAAEEAGVVVSEDDIEQERQLTIERLFVDPAAEGEDLESLLEQFLVQQNIPPHEFDLVIQTNAHLRRAVEPMLEGRITEENLRQAFRIQYGETIRIRHIELANMREIAEARRRLAEGEDFAELARQISRNAETAPRGGELPVFSRATPGLPEAFKETAFSLEEDEVSDPVQAEGAYHLIRMEERIEPRAVDFEDVKESLHEQLYTQWMQAMVRDYRSRLAQQALATIEIEEPILQQQFEQWIEQQRQEQDGPPQTFVPAPPAQPDATPLPAEPDDQHE